MTKIIKITNFKTLLVLIALMIFFFGSVAEASHVWGKYHWNISTDESKVKPLILGDNVDVVWDNSLAIASNDWNLSVLKNQVSTGTSNVNCDPTLGRVEVCNGEYGDNGWLGIAQIWAYRGKDSHIAQGVVKLNDTYFNLETYNTAPWRNLVMCQEIGHTFGLGHQDENFSNENLGTCMDYTNDPDGSVYNQLNNEHPNQHDYDMLSSIYAHLNSGVDNGGSGKGKSGNGKGKTNTVGADINVQNPSAWGRAIKQDALGNNSLFVRDLGNGFELITHVTWVPGHDVKHND